MSVSGIGSSAGAVDFTELRKKMAERMAERMMKDLDADGDGAISKGELANASKAAANSPSSDATGSASSVTSSLDDLFKALDSDGDGVISKSELSSFMEKAGPPTGGPQGSAHAGGPPSGPPPDASSTGAGDSSTSSSSTSSTKSDPADTNGDGTVSAEERMAFAYQQLLAALQRTGSLAGDGAATTSRIDITT